MVRITVFIPMEMVIPMHFCDRPMSVKKDRIETAKRSVFNAILTVLMLSFKRLESGFQDSKFPRAKIVGDHYSFEIRWSPIREPGRGYKVLIYDRQIASTRSGVSTEYPWIVQDRSGSRIIRKLYHVVSNFMTYIS